MEWKQRQAIRERFRAYHSRYTRDAGDEKRDEVRQLRELDPDLHLRFHVLDQRWAVYYDRHGLLTCIRPITPGEPWPRVMQDLRRNAATSKRKLWEIHQACLDVQKRRVDAKIADASHEVGMDLYHMNHGRVYG